MGPGKTLAVQMSHLLYAVPAGPTHGVGVVGADQEGPPLHTGREGAM